VLDFRELVLAEFERLVRQECALVGGGPSRRYRPL